jgi:hypothetical protein
VEIFLIFFIGTIIIGLIGGINNKSPSKHKFIITLLIFNIIYNIFMGVCDATGATENQKNKMRGKSD